MKYLTYLTSAAIALALSAPAEANPARIILLRHAEKLDAYALCDTGRSRAEALSRQFLGRDAAQSLFGADGKPDALMAITLHTYETIAPLAGSWNMPVIHYAVTPAKGEKGKKEDKMEDVATQLAAHDVMTDPRYDGKTIVMVWEHKRIANEKFEAKNPGRQVTLRQMLHLDQLPNVPKTWPDENYNYIWVIDYQPGSPVPAAFHMVREDFTGADSSLPDNDWNTPEPRHIAAGCLK